MSNSASKTEERVHPLTPARHGAVLDRLPDSKEVLLRSLADRWHRFAEQAARSRERPSEKAIHDLRVATRRLLAVLDIVGAIAPSDQISKLRKRMKRYLQALSALRDTQVQILLLRELARKFPDLGLFLTVLMVREKQLVKSARKEIATLRIPSTEEEIVRIEEALASVLADPVVRDAAGPVLVGVTAQAFARAAALKRGALTGNSERVHRYRVAFKRFRYTVETLQPMLPEVNGQLLKAMNRYQVRMGDIQDFDVLARSVTAYAIHRSKLKPEQFRPVKDHLVSRRKNLVQEFIDKADEIAMFWAKLRPRESRMVQA